MKEEEKRSKGRKGETGKPQIEKKRKEKTLFFV